MTLMLSIIRSGVPPLMAVCLATAPTWAASQTVGEAKAFFKELDDHTLRRQGEFVNKIYGVKDPKDPAQLAAVDEKVSRDIFDGFGSAAGNAIQVEALQAHGKPVPQARLDEVEKAYKAVKDSGAMARLSELQLSIMQKHFPKAGGGIDVDKVGKAMEMFANGELRKGNADGDGEMNQLHQWYVWKAFAAQAIARNVDKAKWEPILKSLQQGIEIYRQVYPAPNPKDTELNPLVSSDITRFDKAKQLNAADKAAIVKALVPLTTAQVLRREAGTLKGDTPLLALGAQPLNLGLAVAGFSTQVDGRPLVTFTGTLTDAQSGALVSGGNLRFSAREVVIVADSARFLVSGSLHDEGDGHYTLGLVVPTFVHAVSLDVFETGSQTWGAVAVAVPEPPLAMLLIAGGLVVGVLTDSSTSERAVVAT